MNTTLETTGELGDADWLLGWGGVDVPLLICMPILLVLSAGFSGSETALFGLRQTQRMRLREHHPLAGRAVDALLAEPRMLLITILLANTTINVLYFVMSSVLLMHTTAGPGGQAALAAVALLTIILFGEITPKVIATANRPGFATICAPLVLTVHSAIAPVRIALSRMVIEPLSRLTVPNAAPARLDDEDLRSIVEIFTREGVLDDAEQRVLREVVALGRLRVHDVMRPRVQMVAVPDDADRQRVREIIESNPATTLPVYRDSMDDIIGILHVKRYLLDDRVERVTDPRVMTAPRFVPELATLDHLLDGFRRWRTRFAIAVDEYGGTDGVVSVEDVVAEIVGDIVAAHKAQPDPPQIIGLGHWRVDGTMSVHDWADAFGVNIETSKVTTVGGLIAERLGRLPQPGDVIDIPPARIRVERVVDRRAEHLIVDLPLDDGAGGAT